MSRSTRAPCAACQGDPSRSTWTSAGGEGGGEGPRGRQGPRLLSGPSCRRRAQPTDARPRPARRTGNAATRTPRGGRRSASPCRRGRSPCARRSSACAAVRTSAHATAASARGPGSGCPARARRARRSPARGQLVPAAQVMRGRTVGDRGFGIAEPAPCLGRSAPSLAGVGGQAPQLEAVGAVGFVERRPAVGQHDPASE